MGGKTIDTIMRQISPRWAGVVAGLPRLELDDLADALHWRRVQLMAEQLTAAGAPSSAGEADRPHRYVLVGDPAPGGDRYWATIEECRRLLDMLASPGWGTRTPSAAVRSWAGTLAPLDVSDLVADGPPVDEVTIAEAARETSLSRQRILQAIDREELPAVQRAVRGQPRQVWYIKREDIWQWRLSVRPAGRPPKPADPISPDLAQNP